VRDPYLVPPGEYELSIALLPVLRA